jgi:hypothetical protein
MAAAAAAMQGMSCIMMMQMAQKEEDPQMKQMMMMMAMQQCAQAAATAANAAQNKDGSQKLTQNDIPKQSQLSPAQPVQAASPKESNIPQDTGTQPSNDTTTASTTIPTADTQSPDLSFLNKAAAPVNNGSDFKLSAPADSTSDLKPIDKGKLTLDEGAKEGPTPAGGTGAVANSGSFASSLNSTAGGTTAGADAKKGDAVISLESTSLGGAGRGKDRSIAPGDGGGAGEGAAGGGEGKSGDSFDAMLSSLMGGGAAPGAPTLGSLGGGMDILTLPVKNKNADGRAPNIFEYASFRYKNLANNEGRIRKRLLRRPTTTGAATVAKVTKTE